MQTTKIDKRRVENARIGNTMKVVGKVIVSGLALSLALFAIAVSPTFAQTPPAGPMSSGMPNHEQMHQMLDDMHGAGASQRMHEMMGPDADKMIDQLVSMQGTMQGMMDDPGMAAMPDDQKQMMQDMMSMTQNVSRMMLQMMGTMSSNAMPMDVTRDHQAMMQQMLDMMQQMMAVMKGMQCGTPTGPASAPAQLSKG